MIFLYCCIWIMSVGGTFNEWEWKHLYRSTLLEVVTESNYEAFWSWYMRGLKKTKRLCCKEIWSNKKLPIEDRRDGKSTEMARLVRKFSCQIQLNALLVPNATTLLSMKFSKWANTHYWRQTGHWKQRKTRHVGGFC